MAGSELIPSVATGTGHVMGWATIRDRLPSFTAAPVTRSHVPASNLRFFHPYSLSTTMSARMAICRRVASKRVGLSV